MKVLVNEGDTLLIGREGQPIYMGSANKLKLIHRTIRENKYKDYKIIKGRGEWFHLHAYSKYDNGFTPPIYDDGYFDFVDKFDPSDD